MNKKAFVNPKGLDMIKINQSLSHILLCQKKSRLRILLRIIESFTEVVKRLFLCACLTGLYFSHGGQVAPARRSRNQLLMMHKQFNSVHSVQLCYCYLFLLSTKQPPNPKALSLL